MAVDIVVNARDEDADSLRPALELAALPEELLTLIAGQLDWKSIIKLRQTCHLMKELSRRREVWLMVLERGLATTFPQPFFLKKPLEQCSGADIEDTVVRWEAAWPTSSAVPAKACTFYVDKSHLKVSPPLSASGIGTSQATSSAVRLLPGGRFLVYGCSDGSVRYLDLVEESDSDLIPNLLIAPPFPEDNNKSYDIHIALDYRSGPFTQTSNGANYISSFNMASIVSNRFDVWRIEVEQVSSEQNTLRLRASAHLSSFIEPHTHLHGFDLFGTHLAYSVVQETLPDSCAVIIDWEKANGKLGKHDEQVERYFLPKIAAEDLILLPMGTILTANHDKKTSVQVYNWSLEGRFSTLTSDEQQLEQVIPRWQHTFSNLNPRTISPVIVSNEIRMMFPDDTGLHLLFIPLDEFSSPRLECFQAASGEFGRQGRVQLFGYHRAVDFSLEHVKVCRAIQYAWPDEEQTRSFRFMKLDHDPSKTGIRRVIRPMFDQFSNTVVYINVSLTRLVKLQLLIQD